MNNMNNYVCMYQAIRVVRRLCSKQWTNTENIHMVRYFPWLL